MEEFKERLKIILFTFLDAIERFWDNRFRRDEPTNETLYLRMELDKARQEYYRVVELFTQKPENESTTDADIEFKSIGGRPHWRVQANKLAEESRKQKKLMDEAATLQRRMKSQSELVSQVMGTSPGLTTEQLEVELLSGK